MHYLKAFIERGSGTSTARASDLMTTVIGACNSVKQRSYYLAIDSSSAIKLNLSNNGFSVLTTLDVVEVTFARSNLVQSTQQVRFYLDSLNYLILSRASGCSEHVLF